MKGDDIVDGEGNSVLLRGASLCGWTNRGWYLVSLHVADKADNTDPFNRKTSLQVRNAQLFARERDSKRSLIPQGIQDEDFKSAKRWAKSLPSESGVVLGQGLSLMCGLLVLV